MDNDSTFNICTRCGKQRVIAKSYEEKIGNSLVKYIERVCPDPECQKEVDRLLFVEETNRLRIKTERIKNEEERLRAKQNLLALKRL